MDEVCRGYALDHLGSDGCSLEDIANQVWILNTTDWIRGLDYINGDLCKGLDLSGFSRVLHEFAMKSVEDLFKFHEDQGGQILKESWDLLGVKRRWIEGKISDKKLEKAISAYRSAYGVTSLAVGLVADLAPLMDASRDADWVTSKTVYYATYRTAYRAAYWTAYWSADRSKNRAIEKKRQVDMLGDMLEDSVGIERGVKGKSLESKVIEGGL